MARWFPTTVEVDLREGGAMAFTFPGGEMEPMGGRVLELDPRAVFAFLWGTERAAARARARGRRHAG